MMTMKHYTNQQMRNDFIIWLVNNYGYDINVVNIPDNSRKLSNRYYKENKILIPKLTIYRWLKRFDEYKYKPFKIIASDYINKSLI